MKFKSAFLVTVIAAGLTLAVPAAAESRFGFKLGGGLASVGGGDINTGLQGYMDYIKDMFEIVIPGEVSGEYKPFQFGLGFNAEIFYQVTPKFAVGLGVGYFSMSEDSSLNIVLGSNSMTALWTPEVAAVPVTLNFHYDLPLADRLDLVLTAGAGMYFARYDLEELEGDTTDLVKTNGSGFGAHGGLGLAFELSPRFFLTLDVLGRYARIGELTGTRVNDPGSEGTIWFFEADMDSLGLGTYPLAIWSESVPYGEGLILRSLRKARLGLSGFSASFGILIRI